MRGMVAAVLVVAVFLILLVLLTGAAALPAPAPAPDLTRSHRMAEGTMDTTPMGAQAGPATPVAETKPGRIPDTEENRRGKARNEREKET